MYSFNSLIAMVFTSSAEVAAEVAAEVLLPRVPTGKEVNPVITKNISCLSRGCTWLKRGTRRAGGLDFSPLHMFYREGEGDYTSWMAKAKH
eukprot:80468-Rhodomonas_salina.1